MKSFYFTIRNRLILFLRRLSKSPLIGTELTFISSGVVQKVRIVQVTDSHTFMVDRAVGETGRMTTRITSAGVLL